MKNRKLYTAMMPLVVMFLWALPMAGQINRGVLEGIVTDLQGGVVPGVEVTVTSLDTNIAAITKTNATGYYQVNNLLPGKYRALYAMSGFSPLEMTNIEITPGVETRLDAQLKVGTTLQTIEVVANASQIETAATNYSTTLGSQVVADIPLAGRDIQQLVFLIPGITAEIGPPGSNFGFNSEYGSWPDPTHLQGSSVEVNGGSGGSNAWYLDGSLNISNIGENEAVNPSPDAVEEFQAITSGLAAEYGHTGAGVFSVVLKSGTNSLHGDVYDYLRNSALNARNPFTSISSTGQIIPSKVLHFNDAGGTLGGPVYIPNIYNGKNRTFFFFSYDQSILHLMGSEVLTVPTALMRKGNFSEVPGIAQHGIYNPYSTVGPDSEGEFARSAFGTPITPNGCTGSIVGGLAVNPTAATCNFSAQIPATIPTPNGSVPGLNPLALYYLNSMPLPNFINPNTACPIGEGGLPICSNYQGTLGNSQTTGNLSVKIDHQWSDKSKFFGEWLYSPGQYRYSRVPFTGPSAPVYGGFGGNYPTDNESQVIGLGNTYTLSPTIINEFRASYSRQFLHASLGALSGLMDLPAQEQELAPYNIPTNAQFYPVPNFDVYTPGGGYFSTGPAGWADTYQMGEAYTIQDNVTMIRGKHTLKTGFLDRLEHYAYGSGVPTQLGFGGGTDDNPVTGLGGAGGLGEFLMGDVPNGNITGAASPIYASSRYRAAFFQDDIRVTSNFTLSAGLRWDMYGWPKNRIAAFMTNFCVSCPNATTGLPGEVVYPGQPGGTPLGHNYLPSNLANFAPRFNLAWMPFHDKGKTVVRAGFDIIYSDQIEDFQNPVDSITEAPGIFTATSWGGSYYPQQCASYTGECVAFPLTPGVNVGAIATPPYTPVSNVYKKGPDFGYGVVAMAKPRRFPMVQMWNLEIQRELPGHLALSVGYFGNEGSHLLGTGGENYDYVPLSKQIQERSSIDAVVPITNYYSGKTAAALANIWGTDQLPNYILQSPFPAFGGVSVAPGADDNSSYNALNVRLQKRLSSGFTFIAAYTNSKKISTEHVDQAGIWNSDPFHVSLGNLVGGRVGALPYVFSSTYQNPDCRQCDRSLAVDDIPQMFNLASTYELPFGKGKAFLNQSRLLNGFVGGWQLSGTFNAQSGIPIAVSGPCDQLTCRPDLIGNPKAVPGGQNQAHWINAAAFSPPFGTDQSFWANYDPNSPLAYQWGTAGPVIPTLRSPGFWNLDAALSKRFPVGEKRYFQLRWEMFNALNHQNLGFPNAGYCLPPGADGETDLVHQAGCAFGRITNVQTDPRSMQFALKFMF